MVRYFFNVANGKREPDTRGLLLADIGEAREAAIRFAGDIMSDEPDILKRSHKFSVEVTDDTGEVLFTIVAGFDNSQRNGTLSE